MSPALRGITTADLDAWATTLEGIANTHPDRCHELARIAAQLRHGPVRAWETATEEDR